MLTPFTLNFSIKKGQTFRKHLQFFEPDNVTPVNMTGWRARMQGRPEPGSDILLFDINTENGGITLDPISGDIDLYLSDEEVDTFTWDKCYHDFKFYDPNGDEYYLFEGTFTLRTRVTV